MQAIRCAAEISRVGSRLLIRLPEAASAKLPSRGMAMVEGTINGFGFLTALEPDGKGSHWFLVDEATREGSGAAADDTVMLVIEPARRWREPDVPADLKSALDADPKAHACWLDTTTMARWDWIRWVRSTNEPQTRRRRIEVACAKLRSGQRRPCCFNRSMCTDPSVSRNGVLIELD